MKLRGTCPVCEHDTGLMSDGTLQRHVPPKDLEKVWGTVQGAQLPLCPGSFRAPRQEEAETWRVMM